MVLPDPLIGQQLGDYKIESLLGKGGMARVYKGFDENLERYAAVKVITSEFAATTDQAEYTERFQKEARAIARLRHPHIVGIYQFGQSTGLYYMAMVFLDGEDLRYRLRNYAKQGRRMPVNEILKMATEVADALDYAHSQGVIHRDIKPSNIMMTSRGAVLTDFGLALSTSEGTMGDTFGSAHYIAPEQAVSSARAVAQSDLYSLGIVLYECLTGKVPFDDPSAMSVALKHLNERPPSLTASNADLPQALEDVMMRVLDKDPTNRYESGRAFVKALYEAVDRKLPEDMFLEDPDSVDTVVESNANSDSESGSALEAYLQSLREGNLQKRPSVAENILTDIIKEATSPKRPSALSKEIAKQQAEEPFEAFESSGVPLTFNRPRDEVKFWQKPLPIILIATVVGLLLLGGTLFAFSGDDGDAENGDVAASTDTPTAEQPTDSDITAVSGGIDPTATPSKEVTATATPTASPTPTEATSSPTASLTEQPTLTPTVAEDTVTPTNTAGVATEERPTVVPTNTEVTVPVQTVDPDDPPEVRLEFNTRRLKMTNISGRRQNLGHLVFEGNVEGRFESLDWWSIDDVSNSIYSFRSDGCLQVVVDANAVDPRLCRFYNGWLVLEPTQEPFWSGDNETFTVYNRGVVIAECKVVDGLCEFALP